jgi:hypothetical protein
MSWATRKNKINAGSDYDFLTCIPEVENPSVSADEMKNRIVREFNRLSIREIITVDPYFGVAEMGLFIELFAHSANRTLKIYTQYKTPTEHNKDNGLANKFDNRQKIQELKKDLEEKGIFNSVSIFHVKTAFHDRYIAGYDADGRLHLFQFGGSFNMFFTKHSSVVRITNQSFCSHFKELIKKFEGNADEI